jgi:hypothetical protein
MVGILPSVPATVVKHSKTGPNFVGNGIQTIIDDTANSQYYVGGYFLGVQNHETKRFAALDMPTQTFQNHGLAMDGVVYQIASSGDGGYFIGGTFTSINGFARRGIAKLDGSYQLVTSWDANLSTGGTVGGIEVSNGIVYFGGIFTTVQGSSRSNIAAISVVAGTITTWNPSANGEVKVIRINNSVVYAGGAFTTIGGATRNNIAALNITSGVATSWDANSNGTVIDILLTNDTIYLSGDFTSINSTVTRNKLASTDVVSGTVLAFNPNVNNSVVSMALVGSNIYFGGSFTTVGGVARISIAAVDSVTGSVASWNPVINNVVTSVVKRPSSSNIIFSGWTDQVNGDTAFQYTVEINSSTGAAVKYWHGVGKYEKLFVTSNDQLLFGGGNGSYGVVNRSGASARPGIAVIGYDGTIKPFSVDFAGSWAVYDIELVGTTLYIVGTFTSVNGTARAGYAAINVTNNAVLAGSHTFKDRYGTGDRFPQIVTVYNGNVYLGGRFQFVDGQTKTGCCSLDSSGNLRSWAANAPDDNYGMSYIFGYGSNIYMFGDFFTVNGTNCTQAIIVSEASGSVINASLRFTSASGSSYLFSNAAQDPSNGDIYIGGTFDTVGGVSRNRMACLNSSFGVKSWNPTTGTYSSAYVGGNIFQVLANEVLVYVGVATLNGVTQSDAYRAIGYYFYGTVDKSTGTTLIENFENYNTVPVYTLYRKDNNSLVLWSNYNAASGTSKTFMKIFDTRDKKARKQ